MPHAKGFSAFLDWLGMNPLCSAVESPEGHLVVLIHYLKHFNSKARLAKKGVQSSNGVAKRTVLRRATADIAFASDFLGIFQPWPVHSPQVKMLCKSHFKRASKGLVQRAPFKYSPADRACQDLGLPPNRRFYLHRPGGFQGESPGWRH